MLYLCNFKSNWGKDYLTQKSLIAALIRFEEYDKFCDVRADASHITKAELVGIDFKYSFLTQGPEKDYSRNFMFEKVQKTMGMITLVYAESMRICLLSQYYRSQLQDL